MKKLLLIIGLGLFLFLVSCSSTTAASSVQVIDASVGQSMMEEDSSIKLIDVRELSEYNAGHIEGAILIPLGTIEENAETLLPDKDAKYILYCRSGNRSNQAAQIFIDLGYKNVYDMGGIINWPYDIVT